MTAGRAAIVTPGTDGRSGGVERFSVELAGVLRDGGWQVDFTTPQTKGATWQQKLGVDPFVAARSCARALGEPPALTITNGFLAAGAIRSRPRIHVFHGTMVGHVGTGESHRRLHDRVRRLAGTGLAEALSGRGAHVVAVSEAAAEEVRRYYRLPVHAVIENGVDTARFAPGNRAEARRQAGLPSDEPVALYVGRLERRKGSDLLVEACRRTGYRLAVAGPSAPAGARHLGSLHAPALAHAYRAADCLLFPSRYEGCSLVVLEALASGLPVVTTEVGWVRTLLRREPAYRVLVCAPEVGDVAAALSRSSSPEAQRATAAASALVRRQNDLATFGRCWREVVAAVTAP